MLVGIYEMDVFGDAARSPNGSLTVDFLAGRVVEGVASAEVLEAVPRYRGALRELCSTAGGSVSELHEATVRYWSDAIERRFAVTILDSGGRRSTTEYAGVPGQRLKIMDSLGRLRPKPSIG
jgi:hypothetical protein